MYVFKGKYQSGGQVSVARAAPRGVCVAWGCGGVGVAGAWRARPPPRTHTHTHTHHPLPSPPPPSLLLQLWVPACDQTIIALVFYHLMMVGLLGLKKSIGAPIFVAILLFFDLMFV